MTNSVFMEREELFWDKLILDIEDGRVVPVVGRGALKVNYNGENVGYYELVAQKLAELFKVSSERLHADEELNTVVGRYLEKNTHRDLERIYRHVPKLLLQLNRPIIDSLVRLASIRYFELFVSTTIDSLLSDALERARGQLPTSISYSPESDLSRSDLKDDYHLNQTPTVFHLFGKASPAGGYALTQEDTLEFMHALQSESRQPQMLFDELSQKNILLLGCTFNGWLARFFLRITKRDRLLLASGTNYLADSRVVEDDKLVYFLNRYSPGTEIYQGDVTDFY